MITARWFFSTYIVGERSPFFNSTRKLKKQHSNYFLNMLYNKGKKEVRNEKKVFRDIFNFNLFNRYKF